MYMNARDGIGIASYHFVSEDRSYISYEDERCSRVFPCFLFHEEAFDGTKSMATPKEETCEETDTGPTRSQ